MVKNVLLIIAFNLFRDEEYIEPKEIFGSAGFKTTTASNRTGTAKGKLGLQVKVDLDLEQIKVSDYDAILFVGGPGANVFFNDPNAHRIAQEAVAQGKVLGAICGAPPILARANVLQGKKATMFMDTGDFAKHGATYTGNGVEIDGKIITATGPDTAKAWAEEIIKAIK